MPSGTITPAPTPPARLVRQANSTPSASASGDDDASEDDDIVEFCEPYTLKQGSSSWEFHLTDPLPGAWTADMNCKWQGAIKDADLTCTITQSGYAPPPTVRGVQTSVIGKAEISSMGFIQPVAVETRSPTGSALPNRTASGAAQSTAFAPAGPLPTGGTIFAGSAAAIFAVALAL